jgi:hypothetical protein
MSSSKLVVHIDGWQINTYADSRARSHFYIYGRPLCGLREFPRVRTYRPLGRFCEECDEALMDIVELNNKFAADRHAMTRKEHQYAG